jgi:tetratricopeptide (TPR) repeat protein
MKAMFTTLSCLAVCSVSFSQADSSAVYFQKALAEKTAKRYLVASGYLDKAVEINPKFEEAYLQDAYINLEMRKTDKAIELFLKVHEINPGNTVAIKELTELYYSYHQYDKAIEFAQKCKDCENSERIIAMCSYQQEDYATAITGLQNVLLKNPNDAEASYTIGRSYLELEQENKAIPYYKKAVDGDPSKTMWAYELGIVYYNLEDYGNAITMFNKALDNGYQHSADIDENLGYAYIYHGDFSKGETLLLALLAKRPGDKEMLRNMADAYYKAKQYDQSLNYCQKLMEMDSKDAKALYQAGLCFQKKGDDDRGQKMCDKAIEMDPSLAGLRTKKEDMTGL